MKQQNNGFSLGKVLATLLNMRKFLMLVGLSLLTISQLTAQSTFSRNDSLRGSLSPCRLSYDVSHYDLEVRFQTLMGLPDASGKKVYPINGRVGFQVKHLNEGRCLQLDLQSHLQIDSIVYQGQRISFSSEGASHFLQWPQVPVVGSTSIFQVYYSGHLMIAKRPPWDGGFVFENDAAGKPWVGVACEGLGASSWWPCKDHLSDEPDSMRMTYHIPAGTGVRVVGNGKMTAKYTKDNFETFVFSVRNKINSYNVTVNIADYETFTDTVHLTQSGVQILQYEVLKGNRAKAQQHFEQARAMHRCFEQVFGKYAFWEDGFKVVETPYWGMEHQSAIAYGNGFKNNRWGFDFILVHESGHEWWGNSVSVADHADMWIHEGFTTYSETLLLECNDGLTKAEAYLRSQKSNIRNKHPMAGPVGVNFQQKDTDVYYKGAWMLHTLRKSLYSDELFFELLRMCYQQFYLREIATADMIDFWCRQLGEIYRPFFQTYLYQAELPLLRVEQQMKDGYYQYKLKFEQVAPGFQLRLPVGAELMTVGEREVLIYTEKEVAFDALKKHFLINVLLIL
ncbi:MAG: aminopeptidase [Sphingobacteriaceae bacterium]|nr:aminopeptidase [Sphingobacteriaceae bacterium]